MVIKEASVELCVNRKFGLIKYVIALMNDAHLDIVAHAAVLSHATLNDLGKNRIEQVILKSKLI